MLKSSQKKSVTVGTMNQYLVEKSGLSGLQSVCVSRGTEGRGGRDQPPSIESFAVRMLGEGVDGHGISDVPSRPKATRSTCSLDNGPHDS